MAALDINKVKDDISIWHAESVKLLKERADFAEENKRLRSELDTAKRALQESQDLNESLKARHAEQIEANQKRTAELATANQSLAKENEACKREVAAVREKFCPQIAAEKRAQKARELEQLKVRSAALEAELKTAEQPAT